MQRVFSAVESFNAGNLDAYIQCYAPAARIHGLPDQYEGTVEGLRQSLVDLRELFQDLRASLVDAFGDHDRMAARIRYRGTHAGASSGMHSAGELTEWEALTIRHFNADGLTTERWMARIG